jgi:hypothetical protein
MILRRQAKSTLTPFLLDHGDTFQFTLSSGRVWEMTLGATRAEILARTKFGGAARDPAAKHGDIAAYGFSAEVSINGRPHTLSRVVGTQASFYEPWQIDGVEIWFDAAACIFDAHGGFMGEKDWSLGFLCQPPRHARFAVQEQGRGLCPEPIHPWYANPSRRINIADCYNGEDCWMGPYSGGAAHCGLDVNMPAGTILSAPINFDHHYLFASTAAGYANNRWRGVRRWPDGSEWWLQCHHQVDMLVPVGGPLTAGTPYATGAGVAVGAHEHSHFMFRVLEQGGDYLLDPWILFHAMAQ